MNSCFCPWRWGDAFSEWRNFQWSTELCLTWTTFVCENKRLKLKLEDRIDMSATTQNIHNTKLQSQRSKIFKRNGSKEKRDNGIFATAYNKDLKKYTGVQRKKTSFWKNVRTHHHEPPTKKSVTKELTH